MTRLRWWLRIVGALYVVDFVMKTFVKAPIRSVGRADVLDLAAAGDPAARPRARVYTRDLSCLDRDPHRDYRFGTFPSPRFAACS